MLTYKEKNNLLKNFLNKINNNYELENFKNDIIEIEKIIKENKKVYLGGYKYKGRNTKFYYNTTILFLKEILKIKTIGNDAPRQGQQGQYILFSNIKNNFEKIKFIIELLNIF